MDGTGKAPVKSQKTLEKLREPKPRRRPVPTPPKKGNGRHIGGGEVAALTGAQKKPLKSGPKLKSHHPYRKV